MYRGLYYSPCWFSPNKTASIKPITPAFCSIQKHFITDVHVKFGFPNSPQSPDIGQNSDGSISDFLIKGNCHNSRISDDIDMELGLVTTLDKQNKDKQFDDDVILKIVTSLTFFEFITIFKQSGSRIPGA